MTALATTRPKTPNRINDVAICFDCPRCEGRVRVPKAYAGRRGKCPKCKEVVRVPGKRPAARARDRRKGCRACGEAIRAEAAKCRFCGEWFDRALRDVARSRQSETTPGSAAIILKIWGVIFVAVYGLGVVTACTTIVLVSGTALGPALIRLLTSAVLVRVGIGLYKGQRAAVVGAVVFGGLSLAMSLILVAIAPVIGGTLVLASLALYGPPIAIGVQEWKTLEQITH